MIETVPWEDQEGVDLFKKLRGLLGFVIENQPKNDPRMNEWESLHRFMQAHKLQEAWKDLLGHFKPAPT